MNLKQALKRIEELERQMAILMKERDAKPQFPGFWPAMQPQWIPGTWMQPMEPICGQAGDFPGSTVFLTGMQHIPTQE